MNMKIDAYKPGDVYKRKDWRGFAPSEHLDYVFQNTTSYSVYVGKELICIASGCFITESVGQICMVVSDGIKKKPKDISEALQEMLAFYAASNALRKIYTLVDDAKPVDKKWVERFGFTEEYRMKEAGSSGSDLIGYIKEF